MRETIIVLGGDGYFGWPLALKLAVARPETKIIIADNEWRRNTVRSIGSDSLLPIARLSGRLTAFREIYGQENLHYIKMDVNSDALEELIQNEKPHTIYHLAQQCSAPYSMLGLNEALFTINNNEGNNMRLLWAVRKHVPNAHIIKLGSMGEYANGGIDIAEGYFQPNFNGKTATKPMPFPRQADDVYHISKINDSNYLAMACRKWGLRITEVMQSTLFGVYIDEMAGCETLFTRFDYDDIFGTVVNRFLTQAIAGHPLTVYGRGNQCTGIMPLRDAVNSMEKIAGTNPAAGTHTVINHVTKANCAINEIAQNVKALAEQQGYNVTINHVFDPRNESHLTKENIEVVTEFIDNNISISPINDVLNETMGIINKYRGNICHYAFTQHINAGNMMEASQAPLVPKIPNVANENYWKEFREQYFRAGSINLNPGTLGTMSTPVKNIRREMYSNHCMEASPLGMYEYGRKNLAEISSLCATLWPSDGYELMVANGTSQTINLLALAMLRAFHSEGKGPYKVITSKHEHPGGIGVFEHLPEYEVHYIDDGVLGNENALAKVVAKLQPDVAFISHVYYATGNFSPLNNWEKVIRKEAPACKMILDVTQSIGLYDIPFGIADVVVGSAHKWLFGPHGSGLTWMKADFHHWVKGLFLNGNGLTRSEYTDELCLQGGQDFVMYAEVLAALMLYKKIGRDVVLQRSASLSGIFRRKLEHVLTRSNIQYAILNELPDAPLLSVALYDFNPFELYNALNDNGIHCKCIIDYKGSNTTCNILRFGLPYYETADRLYRVIEEMQRLISISQKQNIQPLINLSSAAA
jgi:UDP-sulfoquinovose synthase